MEKAQKKHTHHTHRLHNTATVDRVNTLIREEKRKEGLNRTREQQTDKRYREYCDAYNREHRTQTHNTDGGWRPLRRYASGLSQWQRWSEEELSQKNTAIDEVLHRHGLAHHTAAVILYDKANGQAGAIMGRVHSTPSETHITVPKVPQLKIQAHRLRTDEWDADDTVIAEGEAITMGELVKAAMQHRAEIYTLE